MPYKRRRRSYKSRRRFGYTRKRRGSRSFRRRFKKRSRYSYRRSRRSGRSMRGGRGRGASRRILRQNGVVASREKIPKYKYKHTRRIPRLGTKLARRVDDHLSTKWSFKLIDGTHETDVSPGFAGTEIFAWLTPSDLHRIWNHCLEQQSRHWAQGGYTDLYVGNPAHWYGWQTQPITFTKIKYFFRVTNDCTAPITVRFNEVRAKRDIPVNFGYSVGSASGTPSEPVESIMQNIQDYAVTIATDARQAGGQYNNAYASSVWAAPNETHTYHRNSYNSWPAIRYYFSIKAKKEVRIEPGCYADFELAYTPTMKLTVNQWLQWMYYPQWNGGNNLGLYGTMIWKGLNHIYPYIQLVGSDSATRNTATTVWGVTPMSAVVKMYLQVDCQMAPLKMSSNYQALIPVSVDDTDPTAAMSHLTTTATQVITRA